MNNDIIRFLAVGDVVGKNGTEYIKNHLYSIKKEYCADIVIVNGENSAAGNGITPESAQTLIYSGADIITTGNHVFRRSEVYDFLDDCKNILRPANYPSQNFGFGSNIYNLCGLKILVMNILGNVYMEHVASAFETAEKILDTEKGNFDISVADFHAEATSEKLAFAHHFDGRINIIFGTHTHVQTNDASILPSGTGYITDLGMTGPKNSVLGVKKEIIIKKFLTKMPCRFDEADGESIFCGAIFDYSLAEKKVVFTDIIKK